jgi:N-acetylmuramoyl-L-alanine amidase
VAYRVYISPSTQEKNTGPNGYIEENAMQEIGNLVVKRLKQLGFVVFQNKPEMSIQQAVADSNSLAVDIHLAIHSNAGGAQGTEVFAYTLPDKETNSYRLAKCLYDEVAPLSPGKDRGIKDGKQLYEVRETNATAALIEVEFHDNEEGAKWITLNYSTIAEALVKAVCKYFNVTYKPEVTQRIFLDGKELPAEQIKQVGGDIYITTRQTGNFPKFERYSNYDVITTKPEQLAVKLVRGYLKDNGVNAGYFGGTLDPVGILVIDYKGLSDRASWRPPRSTFYITEDNKAGIAKPENLSKLDLSVVKYAVAAGPSLLPAPDIAEEDIPTDIQRRTNRTAVGVTKDNLVKLVCTAEMTLFELAEVMRMLGCVAAMNLDGGSSVNMRWKGEAIHKGKPIASAIIIKE